MGTKLLQGVSQKTLKQLQATNAKMQSQSLRKQKEQIQQHSPYSAEINNAFAGYNEFYHLVSLGLDEAIVTRRALIRNIDLDLYVTAKQCTNRELLKKGQPPFLEDDADSCLVLHHIGQNYNAPFAELTPAEHASFGSNKLLHNTKMESWRRNPEKEKAFAVERSQYWRMRGAENVRLELRFNERFEMTGEYISDADHSTEIKVALEQLFSECSVADLTYISNLAQNYIMQKEIGAATLEEFVEQLNKNKITCPQCGTHNISLYGTYRTGKETRQKYKCKSCGKVFSALQNTIVQGCTLSLFQWLRFIDCLYNGYSIAKTARLCELSEAAAFDNRLRLFYALSLLDERVKLSGNVVIDETYVPVSYKGNRTQQKEFEMPRKSRERGGENHTPGLSQNHVCVVCAIDDFGNSIAKVAGLSSPSAEKITQAIKNNINEKEIYSLYTDKSTALKRFAEMNGFPIQQVLSLSNKTKRKRNYEAVRYIQRVNSYHSRLKKFLSGFSGISSELLQGYLSLFSWRDRNRENTTKTAYYELLSVLLEPNRYMPVSAIVDSNIIRNPFEIANVQKVQHPAFANPQNEERAKKIYALYAEGLTLAEIGKRFNCSKQAISQTIQKCRTLGMAYKTRKELEKERLAEENTSWKRDTLARDKYWDLRCRYITLYFIKQMWEGSLDDFYAEVTERYGLSKNTIQNHIATGQRIINLIEFFSANENYEFLTLREVYELIYDRYLELRDNQPHLTREECYHIIANEVGYSKRMVLEIVTKMRNGPIDWETKKKSRSLRLQTLNRDRSVFIDCIKWEGGKEEFLSFAANKYKLSRNDILWIIKLNCMADPSRYDMTKLD